MLQSFIVDGDWTCAQLGVTLPATKGSLPTESHENDWWENSPVSPLRISTVGVARKLKKDPERTFVC